MKTITIYELLGMIKEGKAPKKIKISELIYYFNDESQMYFAENGYELSDNIYLTKNLNHPVEILEEEKKIPEKINIFEELTRIPENFQFNDILLADKLNEVIDYFEYLKSKGE